MAVKIALSLLGALALVVALWNVAFQWRLQRHHGMSRDAFLAYFAERGVGVEAAAAIYDYYRPRAIWRNFGISPQDEIAVLFNQEGDDTDDDLMRILKNLGLSMPSDEAWEARGIPLLKTAEDLVRVVAWAAEVQRS